MGAWGPGIFSNDLACDVREDWREAILAGEDAAEASARLIGRYARELFANPDETEFWTGLAAAQMQTGRLQPGVRDRALAVIAAGGDLELWEDSGQLGLRRRALERLAAKLRGPQPEPRRLRRPPPPPDPGVEVGDVLRIYSRDRARSALFAVVARDDGRHPVVLGLLWEGGVLPPPDELERLPFLSDEHGAEVGLPLLQTVDVTRKRDAFGPHIGEIVARGVKREQPPVTSSFGAWEALVALVGYRLDECLAASRRRLEKYGDDPRPWETARAEHAKLMEPLMPLYEQMLRKILEGR